MNPKFNPKEYDIIDDRDLTHNNCSACNVVIEYGYMATGELLCEKCYLKAVEKRGEELKNRIKEVGEIDFRIRGEL
jgi:hypothetical protein